LRPSHGEVIAEAATMADLLPLWEPGRVVIGWTAAHEPPRRLSQSSLASVRRKRLRRRLEAKFPLLADQLEQAELAARPDFFNGDRRT
jgi:hypothetical protein